MRMIRQVTTIGLASACCLALAAAPASAGDRRGGGHGGGDPFKVIAGGFDGPFQLADGYGNSIIVTQAGKGEVTQIDLRTGGTKTLATGVAGASGASLINGKIAVVTGEEPTEGGPPADEQMMAARGPATGPVPPNFASLLVGRPGGTLTPVADFLQFQEEHNSDGQDTDNPDFLDSLSNPFAVVEDRTHRGFALVTDGGGNAVLRVDRKGNIEEFFVPDVVRTGVCEGRPNNDPAHTGCDPVPTGITNGPWGSVYVAGLSGEAPGEGRVYILDAWSGKLRKTLTGFNSPTGVAVDYRGNVYVAELLCGAPDGPPPTDPNEIAKVGRIVKVTPNGQRTYAQATLPNGLLLSGGKLYASTWSIAFFFGAVGAGQVVQVNDNAFGPDPDGC